MGLLKAYVHGECVATQEQFEIGVQAQHGMIGHFS